MKNRFSYYRLALYVIVLILPLTELALRIVGYGPYSRSTYHIQSEPKQALLPSDSLGLILNPGHFKVVLNKKLHYEVTHNKDGRREESTAPVTLQKESLPKLGMFGCSYTYGMGLNNSEVASSLLQHQNTFGYTVENYAVPGYGTVQGYLQLQELIKTKKAPSIALFMFASFHLERNAMTPQFRRHLKIGFSKADPAFQNQRALCNFPFARLHNTALKIDTISWVTLYENYPGREQWAIVHYLQSNQDKADRRALAPFDTTLALFKAIQALCSKNNIALVVAGIDQHPETQNMLKTLHENSIQTLDLQLPLHKSSYHNAPYDTHPNAKAHGLYAEKIKKHIEINF